MLLPAGFLTELTQAVKNVSLTSNQRVACKYVTEFALKEMSVETPAIAKSGSDAAR